MTTETDNPMDRHAGGEMNQKAIALLSGGLDSTLAARMICDQGVEVTGVFFSMPWGCCDKLHAIKAAHWLGIPLMVLKIQRDYLDMIRQPTYGYGTQMNPCTDCRIHMWTKAKQYMASVGASFLVTGEVAGQRPMSQVRRKLDIIEQDSGLMGRIVRPLSARLLPASLPEQQGIVDRDKLLCIQGRSRKEQIRLAAAVGLVDYPSPAGGCALTEPVFAAKVKDLFAHEVRPETIDMELLTLGRHFRLSCDTKVIIGRTAEENMLLESYVDIHRRLLRPEFPGPTALVIGAWNQEVREQALALIGRYTKRARLHEALVVRAGDETWDIASAQYADAAAAMAVHIT